MMPCSRRFMPGSTGAKNVPSFSKNVSTISGDLTRLDSREIDAIEQAARQHLLPGSRIRLFGSRLDVHRRGGDIDLLIEPPIALAPVELVEQRNGFIAQLYRLLGERRINVVIAPLGLADERPIVAVASRDGILLTEV